MPLINFEQTFGTVDEYMAVIRTIIPAPRPIALKAGRNVINFVDLPDATQLETDQVEAALIANFPRSTRSDAIPVIFPMLVPTTAPVVWTNQPIAITEFLGLTIHRNNFGLGSFSQARLVVNVQTAGGPNAQIGVQASTDDGANFFSLSGVINTAAPFVPIGTVGVIISDVVDLVNDVKTDVLFRLVGRLGAPPLDPAFGSIFLQFR